MSHISLVVSLTNVIKTFQYHTEKIDYYCGKDSFTPSPHSKAVNGLGNECYVTRLVPELVLLIVSLSPQVQVLWP